MFYWKINLTFQGRWKKNNDLRWKIRRIFFFDEEIFFFCVFLLLEYVSGRKFVAIYQHRDVGIWYILLKTMASLLEIKCNHRNEQTCSYIMLLKLDSEWFCVWVWCFWDIGENKSFFVIQANSLNNFNFSRILYILKLKNSFIFKTCQNIFFKCRKFCFKRNMTEKILRLKNLAKNIVKKISKFFYFTKS